MADNEWLARENILPFSWESAGRSAKHCQHQQFTHIYRTICTLYNIYIYSYICTLYNIHTEQNFCKHAVKFSESKNYVILFYVGQAFCGFMDAQLHMEGRGVGLRNSKSNLPHLFFYIFLAIFTWFFLKS